MNPTTTLNWTTSPNWLTFDSLKFTSVKDKENEIDIITIRRESIKKLIHKTETDQYFIIADQHHIVSKESYQKIKTLLENERFKH